MKNKQLIQLGVAVVVLMVAGYFIYMVVNPSKPGQNKPVTYEKITPVNTDFDDATLTTLGDSQKYHDYYSEPDLKSGLGNTQPFGTLR